MRQNPKGRRKKPKARLNNYEALLAEDRNIKLDQVQIHIPAGPRLGGVVVDAEGLRKGFGDRLLIEDLSFTLPPGGIVGVIGPNGAGKTTLFRMITGDEQPDAGIARASARPSSSPTSTSRATRSTRRRPSGRRSPTATTTSRSATGDELARLRRRVQLQGLRPADARSASSRAASATACTSRSCCAAAATSLLLDEPTNDLDVDTLRALEEALLAFPGCAVVISHDRWFLDRVATHVLAFEGDSQVTWFEGNFEAYEEHRRAQLGDEADRPHRITYKKLSRA